MITPQARWAAWAERLERWKLDGLAAWLLEAGGPLTLLGAQALYFLQPFLPGPQTEAQRAACPGGQAREFIAALACMLEDEDETRAFAAYLRGEVRR